MTKRKVLLIGWDAADWQIINPLLDSGKMPALSKLVDEGVMGNIATLEPVISPILWNSIATGKFGDKHGVLGFTESSAMSGVHPVLSTTRKTKTIWNILQQNGYKTHQIGWWATHPAEKLSGSSVSNFYGRARYEKGKLIPSPKASIYPDEYQQIFEQFRITPEDISGAHLLPFVPKAAKIDQKNDSRLISIAEMIAESTNYHSVATWILENEDWDFISLYQVAIDTICHKFIKYHPPQLTGIKDCDYEIYKNVVEGIYIYHDMMLDRLLKLAGEDATVIIVSDHGFNSGEQRMLANPNEPAAIAYDHRPYGVFCAKGPGIKKDERVYGASLLDVTPTILNACGIPIGKDMDGKPLVQIFDTPNKLEFIESWDKVDGDSGAPELSAKGNHFTSKEELKQLIDLGYIEDLGDDQQNALEKNSRETKFNLGRIYMHSNRYDKAATVFEELATAFPNEPRFKVRLASAYQRLGKSENCQKLINELREQAENEEALLNEKTPDGEEKKVVWKVPTTVLNMLEANNLLAQEKPKKAIEIYDKLEVEMPINSKVNIQKARAYIAMFDYDTATKEFEKCLKKDPDNAAAWVGLSNCQIVKEKYEESAGSALNAIGRIYYYPRAHFLLGQSLYMLEDYENAVKALEVCLFQNPGYAKARNQLINIYKNHLVNLKEVEKHKSYFSKDEKDTIIIVSGIPRSGTSLMMQMLEATGYKMLTDKLRKADDNNPKGYYELEKVKKLASDASWLKEAKGKVVKVVSQLLFHLPDEFNYKIIFMKRDLKEVIHSQQKMVAKLKKKEMPNIFPTHLEIAYNKNLDRIEKWQSIRANVELQYMDYANLVNNPDVSINVLTEFLSKELDKKKMLESIDISLYRSKGV